MNVEIIKKVMQVQAIVESESQEGYYYKVELTDGEWSCTCPQFKKRGVNCKHIEAVKDEI